jgi:hypothetical protein
MGWEGQLKGDAISWLLEKDCPAVRYLALRDLVKSSASELSAARKTAHREGPIAAVLSEMDEAGYWVEAGPGYNPKYRSTVWAIILLAQLGARLEADRRIQRACAYVLDHGLAESGQFTATGAPSGTADCLQGNLCWSLLELGCNDPRLEKAFDWMARSVTGEGIAPAADRKAPVRYYAGKCGPTFRCGSNHALPCAWGGAKVMLALGRLPAERRPPAVSRAIRQGMDFFFSVDPADAAYPTGYSNKPSQNWWKFGFPVFYVTDLLQLLEALAGVGFGQDPRLKRALDIVREKQDADGRWPLEYDYAGKTWVNFGRKKQPNKWVTLRALRVLESSGESRA